MTPADALNAPCPTCYAGAGHPCKSRHAVALHKARREALIELGATPDQLLVAAVLKPGRKPAGPLANGAPPPAPVFIGETIPENAILETAEYWPPWEPPPVPGCLAGSGIMLSGMVWCPVHEEYEELREGVSAVRMETRR